MPGKKRTVAVALHTYRSPDGVHCTAMRGETIELDDTELARAQRLGAVVEGEVERSPGPVVLPAPPVDPAFAGVLLDGEAAPDADLPDRPADRASKAAWIDYAVVRGMSRPAAEAMSRDELAAKYPAQA